MGSRTARSQATVDRFIRLVTEHHMTEHYLQFYANELEITPKYLSKLVRDVTGRSAPDWIDSFLVLEAKNMLKYSDLAIKEIVFKLNFPDQSSFYKFFKLHTGMIPSEYRKS
jgi:AraC-like DNA-binding protein